MTSKREKVKKLGCMPPACAPVGREKEMRIRRQMKFGTIFVLLFYD